MMSTRTRRPLTAEQRGRDDAARTERLDALHQHLAEQVRALRTGEDWQRWLSFAGRFHSYSFANTLLIQAARPDATAVAGYEAWKAMGRQVKRGERGIAILAPILRRSVRSEANPAAADATRPESTRPETVTASPAPLHWRADDGRRDIDRSASPRDADRSTRALPPRGSGFRVTYVWDVSQTTGPPLPEPPTPRLLTGQAPEGLWDGIAEQLTAAGFGLDRGDCGGANGLTDPGRRVVKVRQDLDDAQAVKTLVHELAHVRLHLPHPGTPAPACRGQIEVEAESVVYLVTAACGLDSSGYTFPYVAAWAGQVSGQTAEDVVRATGQRVLATARDILTTLPLTLGDPGPRQDADQARVLSERTAAAATRTARVRDRAHVATAAGAAPSPTVTARTVTTRDVATRVDQSSAAAPTGTVSPSPSSPSGSLDRSRADRRGSRPAQPGEVTREELLNVHEHAAAFFRSRLDGSWAPAYLGDRSLDGALRRPWNAGYAPARWTGLVDHLRARGHGDDALLASGLAIRARTGRLVDRFRDRVMIPLRDPDGAVIAFIGRARPDADQDRVPRYLNSPMTPLYRKSEHLLGLHEGSAALTRGALPVLVEGPLDAIAVTSGTGGRSVGIAPCGTAITPAQVDTLTRALDRHQGSGPSRVPIVVATDADPAGRAAAGVAYEGLVRRGFEPLGAVLPAGTDPASLLHDRGSAELTAVLTDRAVPLIDLVVDHRLDGWSGRLHGPEDRVGAVRDLAPLIATLPPDAAGRQAQRVARHIDIDLRLVQREVTQRIPLAHDPPTRRAR